MQSAAPAVSRPKALNVRCNTIICITNFLLVGFDLKYNVLYCNFIVRNLIRISPEETNCYPTVAFLFYFCYKLFNQVN